MYTTNRSVNEIDCRDRKHDRKRRALAFAFACRSHVTPMKLDKVAHNRKAETHPSKLPAGFLISLSEAIEDVGQKLSGDSLACIANNYFNVTVHSLQSHLNSTISRSELDGVGKQIPNYPLQSYRITWDKDRRRVDDLLEQYSLSICRRPDCFHSSIDERTRIGRTNI